MADSEPVEAEAEVAAPETAEASTAEADEAPAVSVPKERIKHRPQRPDETELKAQTGHLNDEIQKAKARIEQIKDEIGQKTGNRQKGSEEQQRVKGQLSELRGKFQAELAKKQKIRAELDNHRAARDALSKQQREMRSKCEYMTVDQVDDAISRLENRMAHTSMSLQEEKKAMEDIKRLKASRATVAQHNQRMETLNKDAANNSRTDIVDRLKDTDNRLNEIKAQEDTLRQELAAVTEKDRARGSDIPALIQEREECREVIDAAYGKIKELRAAHRESTNEWRAQENIWQAQRREDYQRRREQGQKEYEERQAERKKRDAEMAGEPFHQQVATCEQLQAYLSKFVTADAVAAAPAAAAAVNVPEGFKAMKKKGEDDDKMDGFFGGLGAGAKGKKGKKGRSDSKKEVKPVDQRLTHTLDMISAFSSLKLETPLFASHVKDAMKEIDGRKDFFLEKRRKVKAEEPVEDAEWEKSAPSTSEGRSKGTTKAAAPKADGLTDIHDWPAIAGSHQIVDEDTTSKSSSTPPATAAAVLAGGGAGAVAAATNAGSAAAAESTPAHANGVDRAEEKPDSSASRAAGLEPASSGISVALTVGNKDTIAVALNVDDEAAAT
ncbi:hypothetical protein WJX73_009668 [Symbiochloris irregularis]|uniref:Uncharacterized protein n=1 Tax=Symbiochloris irregularis TaxID=706552 RepID=A0AAW1PEE4_9CHLO